jgi:hypothetical protein
LILPVIETIYLGGFSAVTLGDLTQIDYVANLCPNEYGSAVYKARAIFNRLTGNYGMFLNNCNQLSPLRDLQAKESSISIQQILHIENGLLQCNSENVFIINIYDISGRLLMQKKMLNGACYIGNLQSGLYFINAYPLNLNGKFFIE